MGRMGAMDRELRDWLLGVAAPGAGPATLDTDAQLSVEGSEYLAQIALDGTLKATLDELGAAEPELAG